MMAILKIILSLLGSNLSSVIIKVLDVIKAFFLYKKTDIQNKIDIRDEKKRKEYEEKVDEITEDGTIEELVNLRRNK